MNWKKFFSNNQKTNLSDLKKIIANLNIFNDKVKIISVVGTNGKGSVSNFINQGLLKANYKVGLFTSPHIIRPNERIKVNNQKIKDLEVSKILQKHPEIKNLHFFKLMFLVALVYFQCQKVDIIILEAGIGGKLDSTNAVDADYGILTSIGIDHESILGNNKELIATDKAGIINHNMHFFLPSILAKSITNIFVKKAKEKEAKWTIVDNQGQTYDQQNKKLAQHFLSVAFNLKYKLSFFKDVAGRTEIHNFKNYQYIYDVAHNYDGMVSVKRKLDSLNIKPKNVVICLAKRKNKKNIINLWNEANVYIFQLNDSFYSGKDLGATEIKDIKQLSFKETTLFIGSFYFIGELWKQKF